MDSTVVDDDDDHHCLGIEYRDDRYDYEYDHDYSKNCDVGDDNKVGNKFDDLELCKLINH